MSLSCVVQSYGKKKTQKQKTLAFPITNVVYIKCIWDILFPVAHDIVTKRSFKIIEQHILNDNQRRNALNSEQIIEFCLMRINIGYTFTNFHESIHITYDIFAIQLCGAGLPCLFLLIEKER